MEYLLVIFPDDRVVLIDEKAEGRSNEIIELEKGTHVISFQSPPDDFRPRQKKITLARTSVITPREVTFAKI